MNREKRNPCLFQIPHKDKNQDTRSFTPTVDNKPAWACASCGILSGRDAAASQAAAAHSHLSGWCCAAVLAQRWGAQGGEEDLAVLAAVQVPAKKPDLDYIT